MRCRICGNGRENRTYEVREMLFGYQELFRYFQCSECQCLQIEDVPQDMSRYYPDNYYAYGSALHRNRARGLLARLRDEYALRGRGLVGSLLYARYPREDLRSLRGLTIGGDTRILDVGCGSGRLLCSLRELGCRNLLGVDRFNTMDIEYDNGVRIRKADIEHVEGKWDVVMFHHSFEHIPNPAEALAAAARLLTPHGHCIVRIPVVSSYAWKHYGVHWVQLDAPRHCYLHSTKSMAVLVDRAGLELRSVVYDSMSLQFWGSEQYAKGIPLRDQRSYAVNPGASIFSRRDISAFAKRAKELNDIREGDQAVFYLRKPIASSA